MRAGPSAWSRILALACVCACKPGGEAREPDPVPAEPAVFVEAAPEPMRPDDTQAQPSVAPSDAQRAMAKESYMAGRQSYEVGDYVDALARFQEAYELAPMPELLFNIARCHEQLQDRGGACATYARISADAASDPDLRELATDKFKGLGC